MILDKIFLLFCFFFTHWINSLIFAKEPAYSNYEAYTHEIRKSFEDQMLKEFHLECMGYGGSYKDKLEKMTLEFSVDRRATVEEARAIEVSSINRLLQIINNHSNIQPYLKERPFTSKNVSIAITFWWPNGNYSDGNIRNVYNISESQKLFYYTLDPFTGDPINLLEEPFKDALELAEASNLKYPYVHKATEVETTIDQVFASFIEEMDQERHLHCTSIGGKIPNGIEEIGAHFTATHPANVKDARELILFTSNKLLTAINNSENLKPYLLEQPFGVPRLKLSISFRDAHSFNYHDGTLESIAIEGNEITYYREVIGAGSPVVAKETYQEAMQIVKSDPRTKNAHPLSN